MAISRNAETGDDILLVDDDPDTLKALKQVLDAEGYKTRAAESANRALLAIKDELPNIALLDLGLPDANGIELMKTLLLEGVEHVIIISGTDSAETTRQCLREGAFDFILKPAHRDDLLQAVRRATSSYHVNKVKAQDYPVIIKPGFGSLETPSKASRGMFASLRKIAASRHANALITGAAGLFKQDIAALVHHYTGRSGSALLINCALETDDKAVVRFEGDFGVSGNRTNIGYLERASKGTLVLDDLSLLPGAVQHVLAEHIHSGREASDNASKMTQQSHCNIIGILKEPFDEALSSGRLQSTLYAALLPNHVDVPALKDRSEDIGFFTKHAISQLNVLLKSEKSVSEDYLDLLTTKRWDGNLIELKNRLLTAYRGTEDGEQIICDPLLWPAVHHDSETLAVQSYGVAPLIGMTLAEAEMKLIKATLASVDDNKSKASKILGISVKTLYNRLKA
ncbi:MAG: sigma-54-dependent transcriptional regulator [Granulosicoccus sp.]